MQSTLSPSLEQPVDKAMPVQASLGFHWIASILGKFITLGLFIDGWAHNHGRVDDTFFTPWHGILYGGILVLALFLGGHWLRNLLRGYGVSRALPVGYGLSLIGVGLFFVGGVADMLWHNTFGFEENLEALVSPSHLFLATAGFLIGTGPVRGLWQRWQQTASLDQANAPSWRTFGPLYLGLISIWSLLTFFTQYAHPIVEPLAASSHWAAGHDTESLGLISILFQSALMTAVLLFLLRRPAPFGLFTVALTVNAALMATQKDGFLFIGSALLAGLLLDLLVRQRPSPGRQQARIVGVAAPVLYFGFYFAGIAVTDTLTWSPSLWMGSLVCAGFVGLLISFLAHPPAFFQIQEPTGP